MTHETIRITTEDKKVLWHYKIEHQCKSLSAAIRHAIEATQEGKDESSTASQSD